ncbi:DMT family transporter [Microbacterium abyssi]|uniref:DMT family transporter n=1 Tax=Microbacterium abyssi TaxID=2782166 RepID=UPI001E3B2FCF|nr:DMT family transporter [Microbacterium sp. A18JL241]
MPKSPIRPAPHVSDETVPRSRGSLTLIAALVTVVLWASAFIGIRGAGPHFDAGALALLRMAVGAAALSILALRHGIRLPARRHWLLVIVWGVGWFCVSPHGHSAHRFALR